ncbi:hypothetical protein PP707_06040 [Acetobacter pasteurianus]|nr:hypothetical protein [Acetobacter pasteurianus]
MKEFSDSGELYNIRYQFYTHQHNRVKSYSLNEFTDENQLKVLEFQVRSTIALGQDASRLIEDGKLKFPDNEELFHLLQAWNDLKDFGTDDSTYFEDLKVATFELQAILTSLYLVKFEKDLDLGIKFLQTYIENINSLQKYNEIEVFLILIQLHYIKGNSKEATNVYRTLTSFPDFAKDDIIYQVIESWYISIQNGNDNINNAYYFYDEILSSSYEEEDVAGKVRNLNTLLALTLQLKHIPEAQEVSKLIQLLTEDGKLATSESENVFDRTGDVIANLVTLDRIVNNGENVLQLLEQLKKVNAEHELVKDEESKNAIFDSIVAKYQASSA